MFATAALPWAATVALPRLTGGIAGIVALVTVVSLTQADAIPLLPAGTSVHPSALIATACLAAAAVGGALA